MRKFYVVGLIVLAAVIIGLAWAEQMTFSTYYPAPYGVYNQMQANRMGVGDTDESGGLDAADQPPANGQLYTARGVIYKPQDSLPAFDTKEGELVYLDDDENDGTPGEFWYRGGGAWVKQGGGGVEVQHFRGTYYHDGDPVDQETTIEIAEVDMAKAFIIFTAYCYTSGGYYETGRAYLTDSTHVRMGWWQNDIAGHSFAYSVQVIEYQ